MTAHRTLLAFAISGASLSVLSGCELYGAAGRCDNVRASQFGGAGGQTACAYTEGTEQTTLLSTLCEAVEGYMEISAQDPKARDINCDQSFDYVCGGWAIGEKASVNVYYYGEFETVDECTAAVEACQDQHGRFFDGPDSQKFADDCPDLVGG